MKFITLRDFCRDSFKTPASASSATPASSELLEGLGLVGKSVVFTDDKAVSNPR
jgi:hypothetical protein